MVVDAPGAVLRVHPHDDRAQWKSTIVVDGVGC